MDISDSDSDNDYDLELALPVEPYRSSNPIHWLEGQVDEMINSTVSRNSDLPAYPIMRYVLSPDGCAESAYGEPPAAAARDAADEGPRTGQDKRAKFQTSKAPFSAVFHSFRLIFGGAIISWNGLEA